MNAQGRTRTQTCARTHTCYKKSGLKSFAMQKRERERTMKTKDVQDAICGLQGEGKELLLLLL